MIQIKRLCQTIAFGSVLFFSSTSQADVIIVDVEPVNQTVGGFLGFPAFSITHTLEGFTLGTAISGVLSIQMRDDRDLAGELTSVIVGIIDFQDGAVVFNPNNGPFISSLGPNSLSELNSSGMITWTLRPWYGDFFVGNATLRVRASQVSQVSEPGTLGLLGFGLAGLGLMARRRRAGR